MPLIPPSELPIEQYHSSAPAWLSKTSIRDFIHHGPSWWKLAYLDRSIPRPTPDGAAQGLALDCFLTEGEQAFYATYVVKPEGLNFSTKEGKAWKAEVEGWHIISAEDHAILLDAVAAVRSLPQWPEIESAQAQMTCRRASPNLGIGLQSRLDWIKTNRGIGWDLKKTRDLSRFPAQAIDLGYHLQAAVAGWCLAGDGIALEHAFLVPVEWKRGARARCFEIPSDVLEAGDAEMRDTAMKIAAHVRSNAWNDDPQPPTPKELDIPEWMRRKLTTE